MGYDFECVLCIGGRFEYCFGCDVVVSGFFVSEYVVYGEIIGEVFDFVYGEWVVLYVD